MGANTESDALVTGAKGHDFRGVHPRDGEDTEGEDVKEEEGEGYEDPLGLMSRYHSQYDFHNWMDVD